MRTITAAMLFMIGCVAQESTMTKEQHTTPCVLPEVLPGSDGVLPGSDGVLCSATDYIQYTADWVSSAGVSPTPPITCTYYPSAQGVPAHDVCRTNAFYGYAPYGGWGTWIIQCYLYETQGTVYSDGCSFESP